MSNRCPGSRCLGDGSCDGFMHKWEKMRSVAPLGSGGNGITTITPPYGITPVKYSPSGSSSIGRSAWEGWRYGAGYIGKNPGMVYGEPDWKYYRHNYCGPCGCTGPCGCFPPGYMGDPNGVNPNVRYIPLDASSLLESGFAKQIVSSETSQLKLGQAGQCGNYTSCGKEHCSECSGVYKKKKPGVKFQVCIGEPECPQTMQPCPQSDVKVYVPTEMLPQCQPKEEEKEQDEQDDETCENGQDDGPNGICDGSGDRGERKPKKKQDYEIIFPDKPDCPPKCSPCNEMLPRSVWHEVDYCGNCTACKFPVKKVCKPSNAMPCLVRGQQQKQQSACGPCCQPKPQICTMDGKRYTTGNVLCNVKRPVRPNMKLRKSNPC